MDEQISVEEYADELVDLILSVVQFGDPREIAMELSECQSDISDVLPHLSTKGWGDPALSFRKQVNDIAKKSSLETRHDENLSYPPSDYSTTGDPVSLVMEGCYKATGHYTTFVYALPELKAALVNSMKKRGIDEDSAWPLITQEWKIWANMMNLPEIAKLTRAMPAYEDYNQGKPHNRSLMDARRKIEHTVDGKIVEKISIETGGTDENGNDGVPFEIPASNDVIAEVTDKVFAEQCLAVLNNEDRKIMTRFADGETLESLARDFGYKTASGMLKRIERIRKQIQEIMEEQ